MSDHDTSSKSLLEGTQDDTIEMCDQSEKKTFYIGESEELSGSDLDEHYAKTGISPILSRHTNFYVEKIEDKRLSFQGTVRDDCQLRKRAAVSENDVTFAGSLNKKMTEMRLSFEEELKKKMCRDCLFRSIQSKLSMLGIVSPSNKDIDVLEESDHSHELETSNKEDNQNETRNSKTLLENLSKRTVSFYSIHLS